jgi:hypothetical protein
MLNLSVNKTLKHNIISCHFISTTIFLHIKSLRISLPHYHTKQISQSWTTKMVNVWIIVEILLY